MITTTEYVQRTIITTDDDGNRTVTTSHSADTVTEYFFTELSETAQARAIRDAIEEEQRAYYENGDGMTGWNISHLWDAYTDLQKHQPIKYHDYYSSFYLTVEDAEKVTPEDGDGFDFYPDICEAWNAYAAAVPLLIEEAEDHEGIASEITAPYYWPWNVADEEPTSVLVWYKAHGDHADRCRYKADELAEQAKDALESKMHELISETEEYYQSEEFWREWLSNGDDRYTRDGARIW